MIQRERVRRGPPVRVGDVELVPLLRTRLAGFAGPAGGWLGATHEPVAVLVRTAGGLAFHRIVEEYDPPRPAG